MCRDPIVFFGERDRRRGIKSFTKGGYDFFFAFVAYWRRSLFLAMLAVLYKFGDGGSQGVTFQDRHH